MVKETPRWSATIPFGVPHASTEDDWYESMFIPKGTICLQNMRLLNFNLEVYGSSNAAEFDRARCLDEEGRVEVLVEGREDTCRLGLGGAYAWVGSWRKGARDRLCDAALGDAIRAS
jgi:cytochrome P450